MAVYYRTKGSIMSLKTLYRRTLKKGLWNKNTCTKRLEKKLKEMLKNILNNTIPETIFYYAINSSVERSFKTAQLSYPICFKIKNIKHWTEISKIEDQLIDYFNSISPKLKRNSNKNCFRKITEGDPGWMLIIILKTKLILVQLST
ncbi:hypothetical protein ACWXVQ_01925 [Mycoplasma sp. 527]